MTPFQWSLGGRIFDLEESAWIMGVLNVTPDSFSDGGCFVEPRAAIEQGKSLFRQGARIVDIGGESTRPGALPVEAEEESRRVLPVIQGLKSDTNGLLSIDTSKATVARSALASGADVLNDVTGLQDPCMVELAAASSCGVIVMHMQGDPRTMQTNPRYSDVVAEVCDFLHRRIHFLARHGVDPGRVAIDPGIGFGKTAAHNAALLEAVPKFCELGRPVVIGVSRKSFLGHVVDSPSMEDRFWPGLAFTSLLREAGARIFRVHDPAPHCQALRMTEAILAHA